ncbi:MAG: hypothetical protein Q7V63_06115 [Gammaproteobacteria bacterium]|nr:hypothetical protein [Gammaproteobacteria bacterium]
MYSCYLEEVNADIRLSFNPETDSATDTPMDSTKDSSSDRPMKSTVFRKLNLVEAKIMAPTASEPRIPSGTSIERISEPGVALTTVFARLHRPEPRRAKPIDGATPTAPTMQLGS